MLIFEYIKIVYQFLKTDLKSITSSTNPFLIHNISRLFETIILDFIILNYNLQICFQLSV